MLTAFEQDLRFKAQRALERLEKAKARGDRVEIAVAKVSVERVQAEPG